MRPFRLPGLLVGCLTRAHVSGANQRFEVCQFQRPETRGEVFRLCFLVAKFQHPFGPTRLTVHAPQPHRGQVEFDILGREGVATKSNARQLVFVPNPACEQRVRFARHRRGRRHLVGHRPNREPHLAVVRGDQVQRQVRQVGVERRPRGRRVPALEQRQHTERGREFVTEVFPLVFLPHLLRCGFRDIATPGALRRALPRVVGFVANRILERVVSLAPVVPAHRDSQRRAGKFVLIQSLQNRVEGFEYVVRVFGNGLPTEEGQKFCVVAGLFS